LFIARLYILLSGKIMEILLMQKIPEEQFFLPGQRAFFEHTWCCLEFTRKISSEAWEPLCLKRRKLRFKRRGADL